MHYFSTNFLLLLLLIQAISANCCIEHERDALLEFKAGVKDNNNRLASWTGKECCNWAGIRCSNRTGHVIKLNLRNTNFELDNYGDFIFDWNHHSLTGKINPSLLFLSDLKHLDLSFNNFSGNKFPNFIGTFGHLKYLNLSHTGLSGIIPPQLGNLSKLMYIDLSYDQYDQFRSGFNLSVDTWWLSDLRSLKHMDMSGVDFKNSNDWVETLNKLSSLEVLILSHNNITQISNRLTFVNFTSLIVLHLCDQYFFNTTIPNWVGNLTSLNRLELNYNFLPGIVPSLHRLTKLTYLSLTINEIEGDIGKLFLEKLSNYTLRNMKYLDISANKFVGTLTGWIGYMTSVTYLSIGFNNLSGTIPIDIANLTNLVHLELRYNSLTGLLLETHLSGLLKLKRLYLGENNLTVLLDSDWTPSIQLNSIELSSSKLGPKFPSWLQRQVAIENLDLTNTGIDDNIPCWLWSLSSLKFLYLSENVLKGELPNSLLHMTKLMELELSNIMLEGKIPALPTSLVYLDLSSNSLSGPLPLCWSNISYGVYLENNRLSGVVPSCLSCSVSLKVLRLENNSLTGEFPFDLQFCKGLELLDLGENNFQGIIPDWVGESFSQLLFLRLRSNLFSGNIPSKLTHNNNLRVLDLANNCLSGPLPRGLGNFSQFSPISVESSESLNEMAKGLTLELEFKDLLYWKIMDLSNNNIIGEIPQEIVVLSGLLILNLSHNHLIGNIPHEIGNMTDIESLDLRMNNLSGTIPQSLSVLYSLEVLNLSYNNLSGSIPTGHQLQTLDDPSIYSGNPYLCGPPLETSCDSSGRFPHNDGNNGSTPKNTGDRDKWLYLFIEFGFVAGFLVVFFILLFKVRWRYTYFEMIDSVFDKFYVMGTITFNRLIIKLYVLACAAEGPVLDLMQ